MSETWLTNFNSLIPLGPGGLQKKGDNGQTHHAQLFLSLFSAWRTEGRKSGVQPPKRLINNFGNKGFDKARGSEVELVLRKRTGDRLSTYAVSPQTHDKVAETAVRSDQRGTGRCWEMQPGAAG